MLSVDRLLPADSSVRSTAHRLYEATSELPIVSPHGHCDPAIFADDHPIPDPEVGLVTKDHYIVRLLYSHGVQLEAFGLRRKGSQSKAIDGRDIWQTLGNGYHFFRGTPSKSWLDHTLSEVLGVELPLGPDTAGEIYDQIASRLAGEEFRPRALFDRFGIEFLATTDGALDHLGSHIRIRESGWEGRVSGRRSGDDLSTSRCEVSTPSRSRRQYSGTDRPSRWPSKQRWPG